MRELNRAIDNALSRIDRHEAVGIPGDRFSLLPALDPRLRYWLDRFGLAPTEKMDDNQQWYGFILGWAPTEKMAVQNEIYFSSPRGQIGIRNFVDAESPSPILLATLSRHFIGRDHELVTGLIAGLQVVGLRREMPRIEMDKFKDYVQKYGSDKVTNHTSVAL